MVTRIFRRNTRARLLARLLLVVLTFLTFPSVARADPCGARLESISTAVATGKFSTSLLDDPDCNAAAMTGTAIQWTAAAGTALTAVLFGLGNTGVPGTKVVPSSSAPTTAPGAPPPPGGPSLLGVTPGTQTTSPPATSPPNEWTEILSGPNALNTLEQMGLVTKKPDGTFVPKYPEFENLGGNPTTHTAGEAFVPGSKTPEQIQTQTITSVTGVGFNLRPDGTIDPNIAITVNVTEPNPNPWQPVTPPSTSPGSTTTTPTTSTPTTSQPPTTSPGDSSQTTPPGDSSQTTPPEQTTKPPDQSKPPVKPPTTQPPTDTTSQPPTDQPPTTQPQTGQTPTTQPQTGQTPSTQTPSTPPSSTSGSGESPQAELWKAIQDGVITLSNPSKWVEDKVGQMQTARDTYQKAVENQNKLEAQGKKQDDLEALISGGLEALEAHEKGKSIDEALEAGIKKGAEKVDPKDIVDQVSKQSGLSPDYVKQLLEMDDEKWKFIKGTISILSKGSGP